MMTSVTLPSSSSIHGGYSTSVAPSEESTSETDFDLPRPATSSMKRCLSAATASTGGDSCKKRRKQSTPIRISATEMDAAVPSTSASEDRPASPPDASAIEPDYRCPVCQLYFDTAEQIQHHIIGEHSQIECKREPEDYSGMQRSDSNLELSIPRPDVPWMNDMQNKEYLPIPPMFMSLPQFAQSDNLPRQSIRIFNPDAYCDLCNKEFCNKYFLKTHKANKHGIYTDTPTTEQQPQQPMGNPVNIPSYTGNVKFQTPVPTTLDNMPTKPETIFPNPFSNKYPKVKQNLFNEESPSNSQNGFSEDKPQPQPQLPSQPPTQAAQEDVQAESSSSPRDPTESTSFKNDPDAGLFYDSIKMSPISSRELDLSNRLRRIGVMNPKAFCEICCKEYCNKYFLRTHKMKRHGIYIPDDREKDMGNFPWPPNIQTSPLNLIMTEQTIQDRKTTSPNDISCDICGIKFQNANLAQLHNVTLHAKMFPKEAESDSAEEMKKTLEQPEPADKSLNAEAISEDLQKLQTMILQLNDLDVTKVSTICNACNKEFENRYYLHAHMMTEHGILLEDMSEEKAAESENSSNNNTMCDLCGKDLPNVAEMKKHILEFHSNQNNTENLKDFSGFSTPEKSNRVMNPMPERRISMNVTPTSSYCEICNKELCNKYFMKTHMQRMHGIEIENGAQIGGVVCDICNKELCSKYFLRVHKHNTHGIVEYGTSLLQPRKSEGEPPVPPIMLPENENSIKPADLADLSHRYFTHFTEVCSICSRRFRSTKWLKAHLMSDHGQVGAEKWAEIEQQLQHNLGQKIKVERTSPTLKIPNGGQEQAPNVGIQNVLSSLFGVDESNAKNYQCSYCPFTTQLLPLLFVHERSHSNSSDGVTLKCPVCPQTFAQPEVLQHHMFTQHPFLPLPPFFNGNNNSFGETSKEPFDGDADADADAEEDKEDKDKEVMIKKMAAQLKQAEIPPEIGQSLKDVAKKSQLPATYALPSSQAASAASSALISGESRESKQKDPGPAAADSGYVMQAFLLEEAAVAERRVVPAVVFLPVLQKQPAPLSVTFTLTPA
ncbi:unnamed protein product [Brassicogethes aeneus]|uniref:C2H2-type domain-containing protein n=1 Tax=Brassicogethes aeneus TaxID=1431903 RepID=A0A9P0BD70_BRAAE|nr:unnamed protein product [Brassicogethes aeneus]